MYFNNTILSILEEQSVLQTTKTKPIVDAIKKRKKITFMYTGPRKPKKDSVRPGKRIKVEPVAIGLSKRGNLIVRAWVEPPSVSKKGFDKTNWRTFMVGRMSSVEITDEVFNNKRPNYKEGDDKSMSVTYVTSDWTKTPEIKPKEEPKPTVTQTPKPKTELPQPKPKEKPSINPQEKIKKYDVDVYNKLKSKIKTAGNEKTIEQSDFDNSVRELYKMKEKDWVDVQQNLGRNTNPGEGTRKRFEKESQTELNNLLSKDNVKIANLEPNQLSESFVKRIKTLIFY